MKKYPICVTIAGSDSCAGAGIQADLKTFQTLQCYGMSVITATTAQNHLAINEVHPIPVIHVETQLNTLLDEYDVAAIKTGMFAKAEQIESVTCILNNYAQIPLIVDPVLGSSSGTEWESHTLVEAIKNLLLPRATMITPNLVEASRLFPDYSISDLQSISENTNTAILLKGGHGIDETTVTDSFINKNDVLTIRHERISTLNSHGTGCTLASAIAANIALGNDLQNSTKTAIDYVHQTLSNSRNYLHDSCKNELRNLPMNHTIKL